MKTFSNRYLRKKGTNEIFIYTDLLMARGDMEEYIPEEVVSDGKERQEEMLVEEVPSLVSSQKFKGGRKK